MVYARLLTDRRVMNRPPAPPVERSKDGTAADYSIGEARLLIGRDAILRDDPYFGRRGLIKDVIPDADHGFLVLVLVYKRRPNSFGKWEELHCPPPNARRFWPPGRVQVL